jgi:hypothetical protein
MDSQTNSQTESQRCVFAILHSELDWDLALGFGFGIWKLGFGSWDLALGFGSWDGLGFGLWALGFT